MHARSTIVGYAVLTVLLTAGAAQGLSDSNTVFSDDIVDGNVTTLDIKDDAVTGPKIKTGGIFGSDIADNAVTGTDINEATIPGFKKVFFARVREDGVLVAGDATDANKSAEGHYQVTFGFDPGPCAATATTSRSTDATTGATNTFAVTNTTIAGNDVDVLTRLQDVDGANTTGDSPFALVLVCP